MSDNVPVPTVELLLKGLKDVVNNWKLFGVSLGVPDCRIDAFIQSDPQGGVDNWKLKMFQFWLQYKTDASWRDVVRALKANDYNKLAASLSRKYLLTADPSETQVSTDEIEAETRATVTFEQLHESFAEMLIYLPDLFTECKCNLSKAQSFLRHLFDTEKFSQCSTFDDLLHQLRGDHIDMFNTYYLRKIITLFAKKMNEKEKRKLKKPIEDYEMERERFLNDTLVIEFHRTVVINPAELSQKTKLMIKVSDRFASKRTLKDIEQLALNAFVECHKSLMCMHATVGSMVISWFIPEGQSDKFEALAKKNIVVFKDAGVEEVTVGGRVVFSSTLEEDIPPASLKEIYTDFYDCLVEAVSDEHTCQSLLTQLSSPALISEEKIAQLTSSKVTGSSFLKTLGLEEEPHLLVPLVSAMSGVEQLQTLAGEMSAVLKQGVSIAQGRHVNMAQLEHKPSMRKLRSRSTEQVPLTDAPLASASRSVDFNKKEDQSTTSANILPITRRRQTDAAMTDALSVKDTPTTITQDSREKTSQFEEIITSQQHSISDIQTIPDEEPMDYQESTSTGNSVDSSMQQPSGKLRSTHVKLKQLRISTQAQSAEYHSFKLHYADLFDMIRNPIPLSMRLSSAKLLSRDSKRKKVPQTEQQVTELLDAVQTSIQLDPQNFYKFLNELEKDSSMQHLSGKLRATCEYSRKWQELQVYVPLMATTIERLKKDDLTQSEQYIKLNSLYGFLNGKNRRIPLSTLEKCERVLVKIFKQPTTDEARDKLGYNVTVSISNVTIQGPPATGKTSVIDLAMGRPPAVDRHSTGVAEPPSCSIIVGDDSYENVEWKELTPDRMLDMVCETIEALAEPVDEHLEPAVQHDTDAIQHETGATCSYNEMVAVPLTIPSYQSHLSSLPSTSARRSPPAASRIAAPPPAKHRRYDFPQILSNIMQRLPKVRGSTRLFSARLILMSDSGGQPNYLDIFPLFVRNKCLAIYTLKLNKLLYGIPEFSYCIQGHPIRMADTMLQYSYWQLLESLAKSMSSFLPSLSLPSSGCHGIARFTVIGTFADRMDECVDESLEDKNTSLARSLKAYEQLRINYKGKAILPINAVTRDKEQRRQYMMELRRQINKAPSIEVTIKLRWFGFYLTLLSLAKAHQRAILPLQECLDIGRSLDMDEQETRMAITFFHNLNLILHYQTDELDMLVIVELKPILDLVSLLIGSSFINEENLHDFFGIDLPAGAREHFQQHGCFDRQTLAECFKFPELLNADKFIHLLAEVKAIAVIEKFNALFMPCVLRYAPVVEEFKIMSELSCPWIVRLKIQDLYGPLPPGFSPALIVLLLSSDSFRIVLGTCQYRNIFVLHYHRGGVITIVEKHVQLEIYYSFSDSDCSVIRSLILEAILETEKRLSFDVDSITIEDSFLCSCNPQIEGPSRHILCKPSCTEPPRARCELTRKICELRKQELRWLPSGGSGNMAEQRSASGSMAAGESHTSTTVDVRGDVSRTLTVDDLCDVLDAVDDLNDWMNLGLRLGLRYPTLQGIAEEQRGNISQCKLKMVVAWLQRQDNVAQKGVPSWSVLRAALKRMGEHEIADRISKSTMWRM